MTGRQGMMELYTASGGSTLMEKVMQEPQPAGRCIGS